MPLEIDYLGEGRSDEAVARKLIEASGHATGRSYLRPLSGTGKNSLDRRLHGLNRGAATGRTVLVVRDLDQDAPCAPALVGRLVTQRDPRMLLRVAVPQVEAWLMADRTSYAQFCGVPVSAIPLAPEEARDLKHVVLRAAAQHKGSKLARHLAECRRRGLADWQALGEWQAEFAISAWQPRRAAESARSTSLARALDCLLRLPSAGND